MFSQEYSLQWDDFPERVCKMFHKLRTESDFYDVTLQCNDSDGRNLLAHKVILASGSSVSKKMIKQTSSNLSNCNPVIYLRGVQYSDLSALLDFLYQGEVRIPIENINSFMLLAEDLQIDALTMNQNARKSGANEFKIASNTLTNDNNKIRAPLMKKEPLCPKTKLTTNNMLADILPENINTAFDRPTAKRYKLGNQRSSNSDTLAELEAMINSEINTKILSNNLTVDDIEDDKDSVNSNINSQFNEEKQINGSSINKLLSDSLQHDTDNVALSAMTEMVGSVEEYYIRPDANASVWKCKMCDKIATNRHHIREHIMDTHFPHVKTQCQNCSSWFKSGQQIRRHLTKCK